MHQSSMFGNRQVAQPAAQIPQIYDLNVIANQFADWNFNVGQPYDQLTPKLCLLVINEIQSQAQKVHTALGGPHPLRVGMFNIISENGFNNAGFQDLVYTIIMRMGHGMQAGEFRNIDLAAGTVIARAVKSCACGMAIGDAEFMASLPPNDQAAVRENAEVWNYLVALAQGQAQFVPFSQMNGNSGLSGVSTTTQSAMEDARALRGSTAGAFVENYDGVTQTRYNNNGGQSVGRYGRRSEIIHGKLEGSMQESLSTALATPSPAAGQRQDPTPTDTGYQSRMKRPAANNAPVAASQTNTSFSNAAKKFDSDVTDFSKSIDTTVGAAPAAAPQPAAPVKPMFTVQIGDDVIEIVRERTKDGFSSWKPSRLQRFHPAWCKRTHHVRYFEAKDGMVLAMLQPLEKNQKEIAMNYDAHAIDPTKGQPEPTVPVKPVREEAKVMYTDAANVNINIVVAKVFAMEEDVTGAIRSARLAAEMSEQVPDAFVKMSMVNSPVVYPTAEDAQEDAILLNAIAKSKDFKEAASYLPKVRNEMARQVINRTLVKAINRAMTCEIGVGVRIGDFIEDGPSIIEFLSEKHGALIGEKMAAHQNAILQANVRVIAATDENIRNYADSVLSPEGDVALSDTMAARVLFLQHNVCAVWVNFNDDEMAIGVPPKGAASIQAESLGALFKIAESVYKDAIGNLTCSEQYLITKDSACYNLHRGLINKDAYLLSQKVD